MNKENSKEPGEQPKNKDDKKQNLQEQLGSLQAEKDDIFARLQRVSADFANYEKRSIKQISESIAYEKEHIIKSLLPVLDNFDHTLSHVENIQEAAEMVKGIKIIYDQFLAVLKTHGVEQISAVGEKFNPVCHQALTQKTEPDKEDQIVLEEFRKGYKLGDKILRPAIVIVNKKPSDQPLEEEQQAGDAGSENGD